MHHVGCEMYRCVLKWHCFLNKRGGQLICKVADKWLGLNKMLVPRDILYVTMSVIFYDRKQELYQR